MESNLRPAVEAAGSLATEMDRRAIEAERVSNIAVDTALNSTLQISWMLIGTTIFSRS